MFACKEVLVTRRYLFVRKSATSVELETSGRRPVQAGGGAASGKTAITSNAAPQLRWAYNATRVEIIGGVGGHKNRDWLPGLDSNQRPFD
jgi:hypothetical protein